MNKIEFKDLPDTTTPLSASNLNTMQDNIEEAINASDIYSTTEKVIGKWIDNKPIYRKVIVINNPPTSNTDYSHYISNLDTIINATANGLQSSGTQQFFPRAVPDDANRSLNIGDITSTTFSLQIASKNTGIYAFTKVNVIFEYTKTTD